MCHDTINCIVTSGGLAARVCCDKPSDKQRHGCDTTRSSTCMRAATRPRYVRDGPETWPTTIYNTATTRRQCAPRHGATRPAWALCTRSVRASRVRWVCTLCTQLSFDSVHCSESLFGILFMNTIHEVLKK